MHALVQRGGDRGRAARDGIRDHAGSTRRPTASRCSARDGRTLRAPLVIAADGVHSVIAQAARRERAMAAHEPRHRHDGGDAGRDAARRAARRALGRLRVQRPRRLRVRVSEDASRQRRHRLPAVALRRRRAPTALRRCRSDSSRRSSSDGVLHGRRIASVSRRF